MKYKRKNLLLNAPDYHIALGGGGGGVRLSGGNQQRSNCLGGTYPEELSGSLLKLSEASSKTTFQANFINFLVDPISGQCFRFITPANTSKPLVFWCIQGL